MSEIEKFENQKKENIAIQGADKNAIVAGHHFMKVANEHNYSYNFTWMGRPIIQYPQDIIALQEIIWSVKPDLIIETGIAHGGSIILSASMLELLGGDGHVLGIDIDIREHNKVEILKHPMAKRITMIEGSSTSEETFNKVKEYVKPEQKVLVILDSNHTHDHVFAELKLYAQFVTKDSYAIVFDTVIEDLGDNYDWKGRPWGKGNNAKTAVWSFLENNKDFEIDKSMDNKLLISVAPDGYLKKVK